jgi:hypothetical protein
MSLPTLPSVILYVPFPPYTPCGSMHSSLSLITLPSVPPFNISSTPPFTNLSLPALLSSSPYTPFGSLSLPSLSYTPPITNLSLPSLLSVSPYTPLFHAPLTPFCLSIHSLLSLPSNSFRSLNTLPLFLYPLLFCSLRYIYLSLLLFCFSPPFLTLTYSPSVSSYSPSVSLPFPQLSHPFIIYSFCSLCPLFSRPLQILPMDDQRNFYNLHK